MSLAHDVERVQSLTALDAMMRRKVLSARQAAAGRRLASSYALGIVGLRHSTGAGSHMPPAYMDARVAAAKDYESARDALGGRLWPVLWSVVCGDEVVSEVAKRRKSNPTAIMAVVKLALDTLADFYQLPE